MQRQVGWRFGLVSQVRALPADGGRPGDGGAGSRARPPSRADWPRRPSNASSQMPLGRGAPALESTAQAITCRVARQDEGRRLPREERPRFHRRLAAQAAGGASDEKHRLILLFGGFSRPVLHSRLSALPPVRPRSKLSDYLRYRSRQSGSWPLRETRDAGIGFLSPFASRKELTPCAFSS